MTPTQARAELARRELARRRGGGEQGQGPRNMSRSSSPQGRRPGAQTVMAVDGLSAQQQTQVARLAADRAFARTRLPMGLGFVTQPILNNTSNPARRQDLGRAFDGFIRDARQAPSVDWRRVGNDAAGMVSRTAQGVARDPMGAAGNVIGAIPSAVAEMTYMPFQREEEEQRAVDMAHILGDRDAEQAAARRANAATAQIGLNMIAPLVPVARSPLRAAGTGGALAAPFALARNNERPLQERLPSALLETGGAAALGGALQAIGGDLGARARARENTINRVQQRGAAFDRAQVRPPLAALEGREAAPMTMSLASSPVGGNVRQNLRNSFDDVGRRLQDLADQTAPPTTRELAGEGLQYDINRFVNGPGRGRTQPAPGGRDPRTISVREWNVRDKATALYDHVEEPILAAEAAGRGRATAENSIAALREINGRVKLADLGEVIHNPRLRRIGMALEGSGRRSSDAFAAAAADDLAPMRAEIEAARRAVGDGDQSLATYVRRKGGLRDDRGDIRARDPAGRGASAVLRADGRTIDDMATAAWEDGFFPGDRSPTANEFLDALSRDLQRPGAVLRPDADAARTANAREILNYYEQQGINTGARGTRLDAELMRLIGDDSRSPVVSYGDLRALRSWVREARGDSGLRGDISAAQLARLESALTRDILASADALGGAGTARQVQAVDRWYRTLADRIESTLEPITNKSNGSLAIGRIRELARTNGSARELLRIRNSVPEAQWRNTTATILREMGMGADGNFSLGRFISEYGGRAGMTDEARRALFGGTGTLLDDLDNLREVAGYLDDVRGFTNWSNTGGNIQSFATGAAGASAVGLGLATGNWQAALLVAGKLAFDRAAGHFLTNPGAVRWLRGLPEAGRTAPAARAHLTRLGEILARDPALAPLLSAQLTRPQSGGSSDSARSTPPAAMPSPSESPPQPLR